MSLIKKIIFLEKTELPETGVVFRRLAGFKLPVTDRFGNFFFFENRHRHFFRSNFVPAVTPASKQTI